MFLDDNIGLDEWGIVGKTEQEAKDILSKSNMTLRVIKRQEKLLCITADCRSNRVNVYVYNEKISFVKYIG